MEDPVPISQGTYDDDGQYVAAAYKVVLSDEDQYSIYDASLPELAPGWREEGFVGTKEEALAYIDKVWTDMRPRSLKEIMAKWPKEQIYSGLMPEMVEQMKAWREAEEEEIRKANEAGDKSYTPENTFRRVQPPNELVKMLLVDQPVEIIRYRSRESGEPDMKQLRTAIDLGGILVRFPGTRGGTEVLANMKNDDGSLNADNVKMTDTHLTFSGRLRLDYTPIRVTATVELATLKGTGRAEVIDDFRIKQLYE